MDVSFQHIYTYKIISVYTIGYYLKFIVLLLIGCSDYFLAKIKHSSNKTNKNNMNIKHSYQCYLGSLKNQYKEKCRENEKKLATLINKKNHQRAINTLAKLNQKLDDGTYKSNVKKKLKEREVVLLDKNPQDSSVEELASFVSKDLKQAASETKNTNSKKVFTSAIESALEILADHQSQTSHKNLQQNINTLIKSDVSTFKKLPLNSELLANTLVLRKRITNAFLESKKKGRCKKFVKLLQLMSRSPEQGWQVGNSRVNNIADAISLAEEIFTKEYKNKYINLTLVKQKELFAKEQPELSIYFSVKNLVSELLNNDSNKDGHEIINHKRGWLLLKQGS